MRAREWAALIGVDQSTLSRWELGEQKIGSQSEGLIRLMYVRVVEEREGRLVVERVAERVAAIFERSSEKEFVCINGNNPSLYSYCSKQEVIAV
jgi:transcriptional regulator with XRE-family HTH domain